MYFEVLLWLQFGKGGSRRLDQTPWWPCYRICEQENGDFILLSLIYLGSAWNYCHVINLVSLQNYLLCDEDMEGRKSEKAKELGYVILDGY